MKLLIVGLGFLFGSAVLQAATIVAISPSSSSIGVGNTVTLNVNISDALDLYAMQFDLAFDPLLLQAISVSPGLFLSSGSGFLPGAIDNSTGTVLFTADSLVGAVPGVSGSGILASIQFVGLSSGSSVIALSNIVLLNSNLADLPIESTSNALVTVGGGSPVPEPKGDVLTALGLSALFVYRLVIKAHMRSEKS